MKTKTSKSTTTRKASNRTSNTRKRKTNNKVYVSPSKALGLCIVIIVVCFSLLFVISPGKSSTKGTEQNGSKGTTKEISLLPPIEERFENKESKPAKTEEKKKDTPKEVSTKPAVTTEQKNSAKESGTKGTESVVTTQEKNTKGTEQNVPTNNTTKPVASTTNSTKGTEQNVTPTSSYNFPQAQNGAQLIFVFDDGGQNLNHIAQFLTLPFPFTVAVLPKLAHSKETAQKVRSSGNEVILHQPMQAVNKAVNPGPGAITPEMDENQIISTLFTNINEIGPIAGMNNHEGSLITADSAKMEVILKMASENGIYFLDSRTNVETKVPYVASALGYSWYERNIFLDNEKTKANALAELKKGLAIANKNGSVIMIGHVWSADFLPAFLKEVYPELKAKGYTFSVVSKSKAIKY